MVIPYFCNVHVEANVTTSVQNQRLHGDAFPFVQLAYVKK